MNGWRQPERRIELVLDDDARSAQTHTNLSGVRTDGHHLWLGGDETATLERLTAVREGRMPFEENGGAEVMARVHAS